MVHPHLRGEARSAHQPWGGGLQGDGHYIPVKVYVCVYVYMNDLNSV